MTASLNASTVIGDAGHFRMVFDSSPVGMAIVALDGSWVDVNEALCSLTGYSRSELLSRDFQSITHPEDLDADLAQLDRLLAGEIAGYQLRKRYLRPDGTPVWVLLSVALVRDGGGEPLYLVAQIVDIDAQLRAEAELEVRKQLFRLTFEASPIGMVVGDSEGVLLEVNQAFADLLGFTREELNGRHHDEFTFAEDRGLGALHGQVTDHDPGRPVVFEKRFVRKDGSVVWAQMTMTSARRDDGSIVRLLHVEDATSRREAHQADERERARLRAVVEVQNELTALAGDRDAVLEAVVRTALDLIGHADGVAAELSAEPDFAPLEGEGVLEYVATAGTLTSSLGMRIDTRESLSGVALRTRAAVRSDDTDDDVRVDAASCRRAGIRSMLIAPLLAGDGAIGVLKLSSQQPNSFDDDDVQLLALLAHSLNGALAQARNSAELRVALEAAERSNRALVAGEERFRIAFARAPLGMLVLDYRGPDLVGCRINEALTAITGFTADDVEHLSLWPGDEAPDDEATARFVDLWEGRTDHLSELLEVPHRDGHLLDLRVHAARQESEDGGRTLVVLVEDAGPELEAQRRLAERARLLELARDAIIVRDLDDRVRYWNPAAVDLYGWSADEVVGHNLDRLLSTVPLDGSDRDAIRTRLLAEGSWEGELEQHGADGRRLIVWSRKALQRDEAGNPIGILTINTDFTARRDAEAALAASEELFRSQFEHSAVGQCIRALDDTLESVNPALARMLGYDDPADLVGRSARVYATAETRAERGAALASIFTGEADSVSYETQLLRRDGSTVDVHFTSSALRNDEGRPVKFVSIFTDISTRKQAERARDEAMAELEEQNRQLREAEQFKTDMIGMLGHEIGNPLTVLSGLTEDAEQTWTRDFNAEQRALFEILERNVRRIRRTVREVLATVTAEAGHLTAHVETVPLREHLARTIAATNVPAELDCAADLVGLVQPEHLDQMVGNLLLNAAKYGGDGAEVRVRRSAGRVEIAVVDHGAGVPAEFRDLLFERFSRDETTAASAGGTGLGLYIVRELARANGGEVGYRETPGGGATFTLDLAAFGGAT